MVGNPLYNYYRSHQGNFRGVDIINPQAPYSQEPVLFFTSQKVWVRGFVVKYFPCDPDP